MELSINSMCWRRRYFWESSHVPWIQICGKHMWKTEIPSHVPGVGIRRQTAESPQKHRKHQTIKLQCSKSNGLQYHNPKTKSKWIENVPPNVFGQSSYDVNPSVKLRCFGVSYEITIQTWSGKSRGHESCIAGGQKHSLPSFESLEFQNHWDHKQHPPRRCKDQTLPLGSRESFTWIILKTILCLVLDFQGPLCCEQSSKSFKKSFVDSFLHLTWLEHFKVILEGLLPLSRPFLGEEP